MVWIFGVGTVKIWLATETRMGFLIAVNGGEIQCDRMTLRLFERIKECANRLLIESHRSKAKSGGKFLRALFKSEQNFNTRQSD